MRVIIDAGHGGVDSGAVGHHAASLVYEKNFTMQVAQLVVGLAPFEVLLTRAGDRKPSWEERVQHSDKYDLFVSIHANSSISKTAHGFETWAYKRASRGALLAHALQHRILGCMHHYFSVKKPSHPVADRGVKFASFYVLRKTACPAALCEFGFISNPVEGLAMLDDSYRRSCAQAIVSGILDFDKGV